MSENRMQDTGSVEFHGDEIVVNILTLFRQFSPGIELELTFRPGIDRRGTLDERTRFSVAALLVGDRRGGSWTIKHPVDGHIQLNYDMAGRTGRWGGLNRTVIVELTDQFDSELFVEGLAPGLERIKILQSDKV